MKINPSKSQIIPFQMVLRPAIPTVYGNVEYARLKVQLERIDEILRVSGAEKLFVEMSLEAYEQKGREDHVTIKIGQLLNQQKHSYRALRCMILKSLLLEDYRELSLRLAESGLCQWFCGLGEMDEVRVPGKSVLQEYAHWLPEESMRKIIRVILNASLGEDSVLNLANDLELETVWMDTTCVKASIHFPVDWVLLRDAVRTLMKATLLIRKHGLKERMEDPQIFMSRMNGLSIRMTQNRRAKDSGKQRKKTLRLMKKLVKVVSAHARRHRETLDQQWEKTDWTRKQAEQVLRRMDGVLLLLPDAQKQAHERIIGERLVENERKILSLYERELHVIVRGKAGAEVEFGNTLLLAEQKNGLLVDWYFHKDSAPADCRQLPESIHRMEGSLGSKIIRELGGDRNFDSSENTKLLEAKGIYNGICPKNPLILKKRMKAKKFVAHQKRRAQTEGRIGILKNVFLGRPLRSKGFDSRQSSVAWSVLTHNLWVLARLPQKETALKKAA